MNTRSIFYRLKQKYLYHFSNDKIRRRIAELNRHQREIILRDNYFKVYGHSQEFPLRFLFLIERFSLFKFFLNTTYLRFEIENEILYAHIGKVKLIISTSEELFIIKEIYVQKCYEVFFPSEFSVIDIGMNVGFTSLFFAQKPNVKKVIGFEPFRPTYDNAIKNFEINKKLYQKIDAYNYGLGDKNETLNTSFSEDLKGKNSTIQSDHSSNEQSVKLVKASDKFHQIFNEHPQDTFFIKMDCEGAEFQIFQDLSKNTLHDKIIGFIIEWHAKYPSEIVKILLDNNYKIHLNGSMDIGLIIAFK